MAGISRVNTLQDGLLNCSKVLSLFVNISMCHFTWSNMKIPGVLID